MGGFGKLSTTHAVSSVNLKLLQSKVDWGENATGLSGSQRTLPCAWPLGRAGPQVRREQPRSCSPGLRAKTQARECRRLALRALSGLERRARAPDSARKFKGDGRQRTPQAVSLEATGRSFSLETAASTCGLVAPEPGTQAAQQGRLRGVPAAASSPAAVFAEYQDTLQSPASWD